MKATLERARAELSMTPRFGLENKIKSRGAGLPGPGVVSTILVILNIWVERPSVVQHLRGA